MSDKLALILHWFSNINNCWGVSVQSSGLSLHIFIGSSYHSMGPNLHLSFLDLAKGKHRPVPENFICGWNQNEVPWLSNIYLISQYKQWVSCPDDHNIYWSNAGPIYYLDPLHFPPFDILGFCKTGLGVDIFIRWVNGYNICFLEVIYYDRGWGELKISPYFHQYSINVGVCELEFSMLSLSVHSGLATYLPKNEFWIIIIWLVIYWVT